MIAIVDRPFWALVVSSAAGMLPGSIVKVVASDLHVSRVIGEMCWRIAEVPAIAIRDRHLRRLADA